MKAKILFTILGIALIIGGLSYQFAALQIFNLLMPKDAGSARIAQDVPYGDEARLKLDVYAPTTGAGPWPVIIFVHGGSWSTGNKNPYEFAGRALAAQGFVTLVPNYRLHPENQFPAFVQDAARAIDWATRHAGEFGGDPTRVFVTGHSAGAYNVALAILDKHYLGDLGTNRSALRGVALLAAPADFLPLDSKITIAVFGHVADLAATQPINFVSNDAPPFLLLHGSSDKTVYPRNSIALAARLNGVGATAEVKLYEGVSHVGIIIALARPLRDKVPALADIITFFRAHQN